MGPKVKKPHINGSGSERKDLEQIQADYELFLQAFEKPTQIYRYLRTRNLISPIFLQRSLSFMRKRRTWGRKSGEKEKGGVFKVDSLLDRKLRDLGSGSSLLDPSTFLTLTFLGYYSENEEKKEDTSSKIPVEVILVKTSQKKRKESSLFSARSSLGFVDVPFNPCEEDPPGKAPALSIPSEAFTSSDIGHQLKTYSILLRVSPKIEEELSNGSLEVDENIEPSSKRRKSSLDDDDKGIVEERSADLVVYDKHSKCLLSEGEYELVLSLSEDFSSLKEISATSSPHKKTWETIGDDDNWDKNPFAAFLSNPTLKFKLSWSSEPAGSLVERPRPLMPRGDDNNVSFLRSNSVKPGSKNSSCSALNTAIKSEKKKSDKLKTSLRIVYQFLYNNNSRQQTEAREDLHCPWCSLNCMELYALLKHLKLSHPRFLFTYLPIPEGARIDVSVSELYDSTYVGNPHDMIRQPPGFAFSRRVPTQRTSVTNVIVCKPKRPLRHSLSEFLEIDDNDLNGPYDGQRPFVTGHNRLYHYSTTCLPMPPNAILEPLEEDQVDPPWLMIKICKMLDEFSDVNEGEKEFMKMWNLHVQHHTYVGDCQMDLALNTFIEKKAEEVVKKGLYRNFVLHVCNLFDFGVISPTLVFQTVSRFQGFMKERGLRIGGGATVKSPRKDFSGLFKSVNQA